MVVAPNHQVLFIFIGFSFPKKNHPAIGVPGYPRCYGTPQTYTRSNCEVFDPLIGFGEVLDSRQLKVGIAKLRMADL